MTAVCIDAQVLKMSLGRAAKRKGFWQANRPIGRALRAEALPGCRLLNDISCRPVMAPVQPRGLEPAQRAGLTDEIWWEHTTLEVCWEPVSPDELRAYKLHEGGGSDPAWSSRADVKADDCRQQ